MKVAITDYSFPDLSVEEAILLPSGNLISAWKEKKSAAELAELVADADAVITQFAPVNADVIASMQKNEGLVGVILPSHLISSHLTHTLPYNNAVHYAVHLSSR